MEAANDLPTNQNELMDYIERYADVLFVRERVEGRWQNAALSALPVKTALRHAFRWVRENHIPVRVLTEEERNALPKAAHK